MADPAGTPSPGGVPTPSGRKNDAPKEPLKRAAAKRAFLAAYAVSRHVGKSADKAQRSRTSIYVWRQTDAKFRARWDAIDLRFPAELEETARSLAVFGTLEPVFQGGARVGKKRRYFPKLIMELLRAEMPEKYGRALLPAPEQTQDPDEAASRVRARIGEMDASFAPPAPPAASPDADASTKADAS